MLYVPYYGSLLLHVLAAEDSPFPHPKRGQMLLLATAAQESQFVYTAQIGGGPARGYLGMEGETESSLWNDYLAYHEDIAEYITSWCGVSGPSEDALTRGLVYQMLMARTLYYWRDPAPLPLAYDLQGQWDTYKAHYNTEAGAATWEQFYTNYQTLVAPYYPAPPSPRR